MPGLRTACSGAKHALQGWHEAVRCELPASGTAVRVTMVQLPAVNTPQFDWVLNRLHGHARPAAPVYQPELAARAVRFAADHPRRREHWVGGSTVGTLVANTLAPSLLDRYLACTGIDAQQGDDRPRRGDEQNNLLSPGDSETDHGAAGGAALLGAAVKGKRTGGRPR
ncbi:hypothetical protein ACFVUY_21510 [Kitasatospora sp. NPDC058063]|uniref:hypothetical protein n=1 Tax=unclassified Kitasatospora TaxID=2633591 RepID=UPI0036D8BB62